MKLSWKVYDADGDYIAGCAYPMDAARLAVANGDGTTICASDHPDRSWTLWTEGLDGRARDPLAVREHMRARLTDLQQQEDAKREARRPVVAAIVYPDSFPVGAWNITVRLSNVLDNARISTIGDVKALGRRGFLKLRYTDRRCLKQLEAILAEYGHALQDEPATPAAPATPDEGVTP